MPGCSLPQWSILILAALVAPRRFAPETTWALSAAGAGHDGKRIFVGGLRDSCTASDLRSAFGGYGPVAEVEMIGERSGRGKRMPFAFVTFDLVGDANAALLAEGQSALADAPAAGADTATPLYRDIRAAFPRAPRTKSNARRSAGVEKRQKILQLAGVVPESDGGAPLPPPPSPACRVVLVCQSSHMDRFGNYLREEAAPAGGLEIEGSLRSHGSRGISLLFLAAARPAAAVAAARDIAEDSIVAPALNGAILT